MKRSVFLLICLVLLLSGSLSAQQELLNGGFLWPRVERDATYAGNPASGTQLITDGDDKVALVFRAPRTCTITEVAYSTKTVTTGGTMDVRLETVSLTTGAPTGTLFGTNTNASSVIADGDDNVSKTVTLTAGAAATQGEVLSMVVVGAASTSINFALGGNWSRGAFPYFAQFLTSYAKLSTAPLFGIKCADTGLYTPIDGILGVISGGTPTQQGFSTSSTPDVWGARFQVPMKVRVRGVWCWCNPGTSGDSNFRLVAADWDGTAGADLATAFIDPHQTETQTSTLVFTFDESVWLTADTWYRVVRDPASTTSVELWYWSTGSLELLNTFQGGQNFHLTSAKDPTGDGSWTNYNSGTFRVPIMGLIIDGFEGSGSGGGSFPFVGEAFLLLLASLTVRALRTRV